MLWQASQRLDKSVEAPSVPVEEEDWAADTTHNLLFQFVSFAADGAAAPPESIYLSFNMYCFESRTTPRAMLQLPADASSRSAPADSELRVEVRELALALAHAL